MMGRRTMEQQAALGMARFLPVALYCSNDSLSASSRCLPFKAGQVHKVSHSKSINKSLFTHWLIVQVLILLPLSLSLAPLSVCVCLWPSVYIYYFNKFCQNIILLFICLNGDAITSLVFNTSTFSRIQSPYFQIQRLLLRQILCVYVSEKYTQ